MLMMHGGRPELCPIVLSVARAWGHRAPFEVEGGNARDSFTHQKVQPYHGTCPCEKTESLGEL
jgi:hypothetical protein